MTFLRTRRPFQQRFEAVQRAGELFMPDTPQNCDEERSKVGVSIGRGGRMTSVTVFYKRPPKELGLDFLMSKSARIV